MKKYEHIIKEVCPESIAEELSVGAGDVLLAINGQEIEDVFDYRYLMKDEYIEVLIRKPDGEEWLLEIDKDYDEDLGVEFETDMMSEYRSCCNKCIFCFIDQMPPDMRKTLYFKDDDSRLSFLQGNYITLTNMNDRDIERIIKMQLAPINISVHTTNPKLRCEMLHNRFAGEKLKYIDRLYDGHVEMNSQIVCCKGVNDGAELARTINDLASYLPFMKSVSVVPAGITKYREGLYPIALFNGDEAAQVIDMVEQYQTKFYGEYGLHFIHASDEWYIMAGRDFPEEERYDGYIQLENGVGMMRLFIEEFWEAIADLKASAEYTKLSGTLKRILTIATGKLTYDTIRSFADKLMELFDGLKINVFAIRNDFFGETITVSGLITGSDLIKQLKEQRALGHELGDTLNIPSNMLRSGEEVFLDDITVADVEAALGMKVVVVDTSGQHFVEAIINDNYNMERVNDEGFVYIKGFGNP
ncbi:MAG: DUF512 domain-containing protein [Clostridium sp.]|nr:DUF512 domain-containing protein [Clostridium sp.]MCM1398712.1 DUF512 domain-containing protein [Clostridium sp.]MCM1458656.1 DUF512 domain-containing protein [Bacteroides sp.]